MADPLTHEQRHKCMSRIRAKDTKPEMMVRRYLHSRGFRYRLNVRRLPGTPDIVLRKYRTVIFIHGCFWHGHKGCRYATKPKTNIEFWEAKIARNRHRDEVTTAHLEALGWTVITVWECELRKNAGMNEKLDALAAEIVWAGNVKSQRETEKRKTRMETKRDREEMLRRQAMLEAEIDALYPIPRNIKLASLE